MLGKIFGVICLISLLFGVVSGNGEALGNAILDGAEQAVTLTVSLIGMMSLWCGLMKILENIGVMSFIARLLSPILKIFFPDAYRRKNGECEIAANISANLLGMGNAATPMAISAMKKLSENGKASDPPTRDGEATDEMIALAVLNTASFSLVPSTILALRRAAGSEDPYRIILPIWIVSASCSLLALLLSKALSVKKKRTRAKASLHNLNVWR